MIRLVAIGLVLWTADSVCAQPAPTDRDASAQPFSVYGGRWEVRGSELWVAAGAGPKLIYNDLKFTAGEVGVEVLLPGKRDGLAGLIVKVSRPGVGADRFDGYEIALDSAGQNLRLGRHRQNFELIEDVPCPVAVDTWVPIVVRMKENSLEVLVNGKSVIRYVDRQHPLKSGAIGLRPWQREARYRNLWVNTDGQRKEIAFTIANDARQDDRGDRIWPATLSLKNLPPIALVTRHPLSRPNAVALDLWSAQPGKPGCAIRIIDPAHGDRPAKTIFSDPGGCIYDMNVSYDARTLFFSYHGKDERHWHIWRINVDGTGLKQLTDGPYYDVSPCLLPGGDIVFVSTRRFGHTVCQPGPSSNLYRMPPDGSLDGGNIRCVSMNTLSDLSPQMLPDGRVLFTRWEYIDRDLTYRQSLWTQYPDGTAYQLYFGNTVRDVGTFWQARPLPGHNDKLFATFAPHHGRPHGAIGLIDRTFGVESARGKGYVYITKEFPAIGDRSHEWAYRDPFPLTDRSLLCSYGGGGTNRYRIYLLDVDDNKRLLYEDPEIGCYHPIPLRPTRVPTPIPSRVEAPAVPPTSTDENPQGTFLLADVYRGLEPSVRRGRVKYLRVMEQVRKTEELVSRAYDQSPVMSYGTYYAKRCWGTVPVEEDGSVCFQAPALREIYFQVLDAEGRELQRMTSAVQAMPGERISCVGCHEPRQSSPASASRIAMAARKPPQKLRPPAWGNDGIVDFATVVQPVLDKYCVECHSGGDPDGGYDLSGDKTRYFNMAYDNLLGRSRSYRQHNMDTGEMQPDEAARDKPLVHFFWLLHTPTAVNQPLWTGSHASRLPDYLDAKHCKQEIPPADRQRVYIWIDANVPYYSTYAHSRSKSPGRRDLWTDVATGGLSAWFAKDFQGVYNRRCAECHGKLEGTIDWQGRYAWINLSNPQLSPALTAHQSKESGGRGIDTPKDGRTPPSLTPDDPDYRTMLRAIETGKQLMLADPGADMPGFKHGRREP